MSQKVPPVVLAYDLGGTKVIVGVVNTHGKVLKKTRAVVPIQKGKNAVINQLGELGKIYLEKYPQIQKVGLASAGPVDPQTGTLLNPTNFVTSDGKEWGKIPIAHLLEKKLKRKVILENDAAAAVLGEHWVGAARGYDNVMVLTLGTGLGTGIITNGHLVRAGRGLHPEAGHIILNYEDASARCGCGNLGCAEAYLSGNHFAKRASIRLGEPHINSREIAERARKGERLPLTLFNEYAKLMAIAIQNYVAIYAPEVVVLTGSFAHASDLFLNDTRSYLRKFLRKRRIGVDLMPKIILSKLQNLAGLIGGAYVALHRN